MGLIVWFWSVPIESCLDLGSLWWKSHKLPSDLGWISSSNFDYTFMPFSIWKSWVSNWHSCICYPCKSSATPHKLYFLDAAKLSSIELWWKIISFGAFLSSIHSIVLPQCKPHVAFIMCCQYHFIWHRVLLPLFFFYIRMHNGSNFFPPTCFCTGHIPCVKLLQEVWIMCTFSFLTPFFCGVIKLWKYIYL